MAIGLSVDHAHPTPLYAQIEQGIRGAVAAGRMPVGTQLPTVRQLAVDLRVNANTVARVYADLERAGVLETRRGVGTFVASPEAAAPRRGREAEVRAVVLRCIDEAAALGFSVKDIRRQLDRLA